MITRNIRKNYQVRKGGENENGGIKKQKEKDRKKKRHDVKCRLPPEGWHKEKFDGASKGNPGTLGCKGVIWNNFGGGVVDFSLPLGFQTNHFVEASLAFQTAKLAFEMGIKNFG